MLIRPGYMLAPPKRPGTYVGFIDALGVSAAAAYGLRKLRAAYAGAAVNVRRSSDNTPQDIGFDASGDFNVAAFNTFVGGGSGFVVTWYDQSGSGADATQATDADQPQLILAGQNGRPIVRFNGSSDTLAYLGSTANPVSVTAFLVGAIQVNNTTVGRFFGDVESGGSDNNQGWVVAAYQATPYVQNATDSLGWSSAFTVGTFHQVAAWVQGGATTSGLSADNGTAVTGAGGSSIFTGQIYLGSAGGVGNFGQVDIGELVLFNTDQTAERTAAYQNQKAYWGTP